MKLKLHAQVCQRVVILKSSGKNLKLVLLVDGKLTFKHVKGGVKLVETDFTIKEEKIKTNIEKFKN